MRPLFLVNTLAGPSRRRDLQGLIRAACGWKEFEVRPCGPREELDELLTSVRGEGFDAVIAVGGDGTVHEIARRLVGTGVPLGIVPTGSGNGFARHLGLPREPRAAVLALSEAKPVAIDTAEVNGTGFIGVMGVGLEAEIAARFAEHGTRGFRTYLRTGLRAVIGHHAGEIEVVADGIASTHLVSTLTVANTGQYGNNARIAPLASVRDGLLDVVLVGDVGLLAAVALGARLFTGSIHRSRAVTTIRAREVIIRRATAGPAHLDGEPCILPAEVRVRNLPASLHVLVTREPR